MSSEAAFAAELGAPIILKPSPRARVMRLRIDDRTRSVLLTFPRRMASRKALEWARTQRSWIEAALAKVPAPVAIAPDGEVPLLGVPHRIDWDPAHPRQPLVQGDRIRIGGPLGTIEARMLRWLQAQARSILAAETRFYAAKANVSVTRVGIGDPRSRWGSCSSSGAIRYSWRLILAPEWVRQATVAHEVAHRVHMNHGREFHALVQDLLGWDPAPARSWLRSEGASIHRFGRV